MAQPVVQSVEQIVSELNPVYQGSIDVINQRRAQIPTMFEAQRQALGAEKVQGFNQINNQMTGRGVSFSGITADEQANYLSTKYLPGLTQLSQQENDSNLALDEALSKITWVPNDMHKLSIFMDNTPSFLFIIIYINLFNK